MSENRVSGSDGEMLACVYIKNLGMEILERNYHFGHCEIDIIARDGNTLVFIEVKSRSNINYGVPEAAVTKTKQRRIIYAAQGYIKTKRFFGRSMRFDVISIINGKVTKYIKSAFDTTYLGGWYL